MNNFSVVMSVYKEDSLSFLMQAIESVVKQTVKPNEFVIVVDGFIDEEKKIFINGLKDKDIQFKIIQIQENKGLANALNVGIRASNFDIIARMDADDMCFFDRFEKQLLFLKENNLDVLGGQMLEFEEEIKKIVSKRTVPTDQKHIVKRMKYLNPFSHPTMMFKKEVFNSLGGYNTKTFPEDYDFFVRAYLKGFKLANLSDPILYFRLGSKKSSMFKRRRGVNIAKKELALYWNFYKIGFYNFFEFLLYSFIKVPIRFLPTNFFKIVYNTITR